MYMSQVILNASAHHQAFNAYHLHPHKWPENPPFTADHIRTCGRQKPSAQPQKLNFVKSLPLYFLVKQ
jgi:hypothetical protein